MSSRQSSNKQNGGRGAPNNGRGNGQPRPTPLQQTLQDHQMAIIPLLVFLLLSTTCLDVILTRRQHRHLSHREHQPQMATPLRHQNKLDNKQKTR